MTFLKAQEKEKQVFEALKGDFGYKNAMQAPRLEKIVVSTGVGKITDKAKLQLIVDRLATITGQKPVPCPAKKPIAAFKTRGGQIIGYKVTLRGSRMYEFLDKVVHIALPRTRDFEGLSVSAIDEMGNYTIGIREHSVFPETSDEDLRDVFSFAITIVTTAKKKEETAAFLRHLGVPLKSE